MAVGAFPLAKLGFLVIKQISKPIANAIARRSKSSRLFREYVCIPTAQLFHWYDVKVRMRLLNLGKVTTVPKLNEEKAIETGSQLLSEFIILGIASSLVIYEYRRSSEKEDAKQLQLEQEKQMLNDKVTSLEFSLEQQATQLRELTRLAYSLDEKLQKRSILSLAKKTIGQEKSPTNVDHEINSVESDKTAAGSVANSANEGAVLSAVNYLISGSQES